MSKNKGQNAAAIETVAKNDAQNKNGEGNVQMTNTTMPKAEKKLEMQLVKFTELTGVTPRSYGSQIVEDKFRVRIAVMGGKVEISGRLQMVTDTVLRTISPKLVVSGRLGNAYINKRTQRKTYPIDTMWGFQGQFVDEQIDRMSCLTFGKFLLKKIESGEVTGDQNLPFFVDDETGELMENPEFNRSIDGDWNVRFLFPTKKGVVDRERVLTDINRQDSYRGYGWSVIEHGKYSLALRTVLRAGREGLYLEWPSYNQNLMRLRNNVEAPNWFDITSGKLLDGVELDQVPADLREMVNPERRAIYLRRRDFINCITANPIGDERESVKRPDGTVFGRPVICNPQIKDSLVNEVVLPTLKSWGLGDLSFSEAEISQSIGAEIEAGLE